MYMIIRNTRRNAWYRYGIPEMIGTTEQNTPLAEDFLHSFCRAAACNARKWTEICMIRGLKVPEKGGTENWDCPCFGGQTLFKRNGPFKKPALTREYLLKSREHLDRFEVIPYSRIFEPGIPIRTPQIPVFLIAVCPRRRYLGRFRLASDLMMGFLWGAPFVFGPLTVDTSAMGGGTVKICLSKVCPRNHGHFSRLEDPICVTSVHWGRSQKLTDWKNLTLCIRMNISLNKY